MGVDADHIEPQPCEDFRKVAQQAGPILRVHDQVDGVDRRARRATPGHVNHPLGLAGHQCGIAWAIRPVDRHATASGDKPPDIVWRRRAAAPGKLRHERPDSDHQHAALARLGHAIGSGRMRNELLRPDFLLRLLGLKYRVDLTQAEFFLCGRHI